MPPLGSTQEQEQQFLAFDILKWALGLAQGCRPTSQLKHTGLRRGCGLLGQSPTAREQQS